MVRSSRAMTLSLKRRWPKSLACTLSRRSTPQCSVSMRRELSKHLTDLIRFCGSPLAEPNGMAFNIFVMARSHCMQRWTLAPATSWERPPLAIPAPSLSTFWGQIVASQPEGREIHIVADNLSAHKTKNVFEFLQANPTVRIHYTPTYSSWLNQVEIWISNIQRDVIARAIFTSTTDLSTTLIRYIKQYNKTATPFRWRVKNADNRIKPVTQRDSDSMH